MDICGYRGEAYSCRVYECIECMVKKLLGVYSVGVRHMAVAVELRL